MALLFFHKYLSFLFHFLLNVPIAFLFLIFFLYPSALQISHLPSSFSPPRLFFLPEINFPIFPTPFPVMRFSWSVSGSSGAWLAILWRERFPTLRSEIWKILHYSRRRYGFERHLEFLSFGSRLRSVMLWEPWTIDSVFSMRARVKKTPAFFFGSGPTKQETSHDASTCQWPNMRSHLIKGVNSFEKEKCVMNVICHTC